MAVHSEATILRESLFDLQVCVPKDWTDEQVVAFASRSVACSPMNPPQIRKQGHPDLAGDPERAPCEQRSDYVHIVLDY